MIKWFDSSFIFLQALATMPHDYTFGPVGLCSDGFQKHQAVGANVFYGSPATSYVQSDFDVRIAVAAQNELENKKKQKLFFCKKNAILVVRRRTMKCWGSSETRFGKV